ncbi:tRNA lysidine(34) synthetase TilS [Evansella tamaricis]|uniref:tRNA(Ile)-lysidine synthase n=1 Tax=Evansella tamaricis TaxID=2069301 RepID=A0ABS6J9W1_9BACI|nr:tRNA lysidine(34) synthetase TilS [Evansella tamaricis]MBU9710477.1 tRNA lysidine(34) synthetase TilS [Evansella tamaricis]
MNQTVDKFILAHQLLDEEDHILIGVSGGPDSMALLHYLNHRHPSSISVAHVEHGLRGKTSIEDMEFVKNFCSKKEIPFYFHQPNVHALKSLKGLSTQEAAREARYNWFLQLMIEIQATKLALAHHGDDQIETVLMRQVRGSYNGLQGIPVRREFGKGSIIRPFLCLEKKEIVKYCIDNHVPYRLDESNTQDTYQRNRFRKSVLPFLKEENPRVHQAFQRQSEWMKEDAILLNNMAEEKTWDTVIVKGKQKVTLSIEEFSLLPMPLQRRGVNLILNYLSPNAVSHMNAKHLEDILALMKRNIPSGTLHLPKGIVIEKSYDHYHFMYGVLGNKEESQEKIEIPIPGMLPLKMGRVRASILSKIDIDLKDESVFMADINKISLPLFIRSREQGDRISPYGLNGSKKVKSIFIEQKIPKGDRVHWPIVTDSHNKIMWIPLLKRSNLALVDEHTEKVVMLEYSLRE